MHELEQKKYRTNIYTALLVIATVILFTLLVLTF
jgi:hypothetical protein